MPMTIEEKGEIQSRYRHLVNYGDDPDAPIEPMTYVDSNGDFLLHIAAVNGDLRTVELLLKAGQDVNQRGDMGCTALHYAKMNGRQEVADFLVAHGADIRAINDFGKIP